MGEMHLRPRHRAAWAGLACAACLALATPASAVDRQNSFGVPQNPQPPPGYNQPPGQPFGQPQAPFPTQQPPAPAPAMSIQQYLVSTWQGQSRDNTGSWAITAVFRPDNTFIQVMILENGQFQLAMMGQYEAQLGPNGGVVTLHPQQWNPRQVCNTGQCQPLNLPPSIPIPFKPLGRDQIQLEDGALQRVGPPT